MCKNFRILEILQGAAPDEYLWGIYGELNMACRDAFIIRPDESRTNSTDLMCTDNIDCQH